MLPPTSLSPSSLPPRLARARAPALTLDAMDVASEPDDAAREPGGQVRA